MKHIRFDWASKKMLRDKANFEILEGFLSELLKDNITIQNILESESNQDTEDDKFNRVDLLVTNSKNEYIIIEIQNTRELDYLYRLLYITSKSIVDHMQKGSKYTNVSTFITISILYFELGQGSDYIYHGKTEFNGLHIGDKLQLSENQKVLFKKDAVYQIFPEHYLIRISNFDENKLSFTQDKFDEWVYFLKTSEIKDNFTAKGLEQAREKLDVMKMSDSERKAYDYYLDKLSTEASIAETIKFEAEQKVKQEVNKIIKQEKLQIAQNMKNAGFSIDDIKNITGLNEDELE